METLADLLDRSVAEHADRTALTIRVGLREDAWSYGRLQEAAHALAAHLREDLNLEPGARVVIWAPNCPQLVAAYFGVLCARLVLVPLDAYTTPEFFARTIDRTSAALVISGHGKRGETPTLALSALPLETGRLYRGERPRPQDTAEIVFTSGTTGSPKGVVLTHANVVANVQSAEAALMPTRDFRLLSVLPLSHMFEQTAGLFLPLHVGASITYTTSRQPPVMLKAMRRKRITVMVAAPQMLELLLGGIEQDVRRRGSFPRWQAAHRLAPYLPRAARRRLFRRVHRELGGCLDLLVSGGAALAPKVADTWERLGVTVLEGYGVTECSPSIASNTRAARRRGSVGRPVSGVDVRIGADAEILVRGANVTPGYWRDEEATRASFTEDGWYRTGDLGKLDADGFLQLRGRLKDLIVLPSGLNVHPEDVESELGRQDAIADCVVVGAPGPHGGPQVHAVIVPRAAGERAREQTAAAVRAANARLAPHQRVSGVTLWEGRELPRTNLRKVKRHEVLAALAQRAPLTAATAPPRAAADNARARVLERLAALAGPRAVLGLESDLSLDVGLDSLARVALAMELEAEIGVSLEDGDLAAARSVADLLALVERGKTTFAPVAFPDWSLRTPARVARGLLQAAVLMPGHTLVCAPFRVGGREHVGDACWPVLLVANHTSHLDTPSILRALPRRLRAKVAVAAAADYFFRTRGLRLVTPLLLNGFPFSREGSVRSSLEHCGELI